MVDTAVIIIQWDEDFFRVDRTESTKTFQPWREHLFSIFHM